VTDSDDLMIINKSGIAIRLGVENLRVMGRATQGVKLINIRENDSIAAVAKVVKEEETELDSDDALLDTSLIQPIPDTESTVNPLENEGEEETES
jgi:DNA gyrase subunit A